MNQYMIVYGNVIDGLTFLGPYSSAEEATGYAEDHLENEHWDVTELFATPVVELNCKLFRVVMPKAGGVPVLQFWNRDGEEGEPRVRSDYRCVTDWLAM